MTMEYTGSHGPLRWVGLFATKPAGQEMAARLAPWLDRRGVAVVHLPAAGVERQRETRGLPGEAGVVVSLGGDGTLLRAARVVPAAVPLLGVNLGRVGFLAEVSPAEVWDMLPAVLEGRFVLDERRLLEGTTGGQDLWAVNDLVVRSGATARLLRLRLTVDGQLAAEMAGDGVVLATATGSTAYGLAAGGPAVPPDLECLVVVPLNSFSLGVRPFLVAPQRTVTVELVEGDALVTADGQESRPLAAGQQLVARLGRRTLRLVRRSPWPFYEVLRAKLFTTPEGGGRR
ncbi:NAD(+)/NADH kinase [Thermaerobacter sp. PB12/4term]|uniref:NAD(+)/NADH kinase n=1 Tax=Thermaerobacter sp. PB12/4term TaxID=2293838 RepID=UPI000E32BA5E|nr:NAD(+)/NADH kinase [Thermaerobacter sp. PB12/4term]QIA27097.1 NAD(+)/NADH kinase [Thermaerobacter sp. PB12/4term]